MLRFLFNFILFGLLFYVIWKFFPEAFTQLVSWVEALYNILISLGEKAASAIQDVTKPDHTREAETLFRLWFS